MNRIQLASVLVVAAIAVVSGSVYLLSSRQAPGITTAPIEDNQPADTVADDGEETASAEVAAGTYVVYQTTRTTDEGREGYANDDIDQTDLYAYSLTEGTTRLVTSITVDESFGGSVVSSVVGEKIFVRRYGGAGQDALVSVDGVATPASKTAQNQLYSANGAVRVEWTYTYEEGKALVDVQAYSTASQADAPLIDELLDSEAFGLTVGYVWPIAISDDGQVVYFRQGCDCDALNLFGLWRYDGSGMTKIDYVAEQRLEEYEINTATNQLIGVSYAHNGPDTDFGGGSPSAPSAVHLVDLLTGEGQVIFEHEGFVFGHPFLSPDGTAYAHDYRDNIVRVRDIGAERQNLDRSVTGYVLDWIDDTLVVNRDGEIILYNLLSDAVTSLARPVGGSSDPDQVIVNYVGVITIK